MSDFPSRATLDAFDDLLRAMKAARDALYNGFEPDNQSRAYHAADEAVKKAGAARTSLLSETARIDPWPDLDTAKRDFTFGELWILGSQYADLLNAAPQDAKPLGAEVNLPAGAAPSSLVSAERVATPRADAFAREWHVERGLRENGPMYGWGALHEAVELARQLERELTEADDTLRVVVGQRDWANKQLLASSAPSSGAVAGAEKIEEAALWLEGYLGVDQSHELYVAAAEHMRELFARSASGWIKTKDREPDGDHSVLASGPNTTTDGEWVNIVSAGYVRRNPNFCTHWQPLPVNPSAADRKANDA